MKIAFVGGGIMAEALIKRLVKDGTVTCDEVKVVDPSPARRELLREQYRVGVEEEHSACLPGADVVILAIKPQEMETAACQMDDIQKEQLLLSIMAGVKLERLVTRFSHELVVRAMPNTPSQIGMGMTVWTATPQVSESHVAHARAILSALGDELYVPDEKYVDMATALSGSGPAYVFLFVEALVEGAVAIGMPRPMAERLALQTLRGSTEYLAQSGKHPAELRNMVTSPGGTTAAPLREFEKGSLRSVVLDAITAAYTRSKEL